MRLLKKKASGIGADRICEVSDSGWGVWNRVYIRVSGKGTSQGFDKGTRDHG